MKPQVVVYTFARCGHSTEPIEKIIRAVDEHINEVGLRKVMPMLRDEIVMEAGLWEEYVEIELCPVCREAFWHAFETLLLAKSGMIPSSS